MPESNTQNRAKAPIGVFDSGVGGLSVLAEIHALLPNERLIYVADSAWAPYGPRGSESIKARSEHLTQWLLAKDIKALVVACNTATAAAAESLRQQLDIPVVAMEPAVKPAAAASRSGVIGVLATTGTLASARFAGLLGRFASDIEVITSPCPGLVEQIEKGELASPATQVILETALAPMRAAGADTVVLGCTHYPFVKPLIQSLMPAGIQLIDTGAAVARQLQAQLQERELLAPEDTGSSPIVEIIANRPAVEAVLDTLYAGPKQFSLSDFAL